MSIFKNLSIERKKKKKKEKKRKKEAKSQQNPMKKQNISRQCPKRIILIILI